MTNDVAERLADDRQELAGHLGRRLGDGIGDPQLELDDRVVAVLLDERGQAADERGALEELGSQAEDEVADVLDREMDRIDGALDARGRLAAIVLHQLGDVLEREAHRVHVLDDPVVEVLGDALPFVDDRQSLELLVEAGVLHRDPGVQGERLDQRPILLAELVPARLVGQVQPAQGDALDRDRDSEEARHRGWFGGNP